MGADVLQFTIKVNADSAETTVSKLQSSFKGLSDVVNSVKSIGLVQLAQGFQQFSEEIKNAVEPTTAPKAMIGFSFKASQTKTVKSTETME